MAEMTFFHDISFFFVSLHILFPVLFPPISHLLTLFIWTNVTGQKTTMKTFLSFFFFSSLLRKSENDNGIINEDDTLLYILNLNAQHALSTW